MAGEDENSSKTASTAEADGGSKADPKAADAKTQSSEDKKMTNAELKKQKQAAKAARRAQAKESTPPAPKEAPKAAPKQTKKNQPAQKAAPARPAEKPKEKKDDPKKTALFGHLYQTPRRSTIAGAGNIHPSVLSLGMQMSSYNVVGSSARCVATLMAFKEVIKSYKTPPMNSLPRHLTSVLSPQIEYLVSCRPMSVSMGNAIRWLKLEINNVDPDTDEDQAKNDLCAAIDRFIQERIHVAGQAISAAASSKIVDGDVVLAFSHSNIVLQSILEAKRLGRKFKMIVIDAKPLFEGKRLADTLVDNGLEVKYSYTHALSHLMPEATKVFLGAHAMLGNGNLFSRVGTAMVAMMAEDCHVPVIVCCEGIKMTDKAHLESIVSNELGPPEEIISDCPEGRNLLEALKDIPDLQILNLMYDVTPAEYITMVITEYGSLPPTSVPVIHRLNTNT